MGLQRTASLLTLMLALASAASSEFAWEPSALMENLMGAPDTTLGTTIGTTLQGRDVPDMQTTLGTTIGFTLAPAVIGGSDVGLALANRLDLFVMPFLKEGHVNDTTLVKKFLATLKVKADLVVAEKAALDSSDTAMDSCLLQENYTLHAWKLCNATRDGLKINATSNCNDRDNADVSTYIIDESPTLGIDYHPEGVYDGPEATCDFLTGKLDGTDYPCDAFVEDIRGAAKAKYTEDHSTWSAAEQKCSYSTDSYGNSVEDCAAKGQAHRYQEEICQNKTTTRQAVICKLETALQGKCSVLSSFTTAVTELAKQEEQRNKEYRTVSLSRCLFMRYSAKGKGTCFGTNVFSECEKEVNGASEEYATKAAEELHGYREEAKTYTSEYNCEPFTLTVGVNGLAYEKSIPADEFSYYTKVDPMTLSVGATGEFSPAVCY